MAVCSTTGFVDPTPCEPAPEEDGSIKDRENRYWIAPLVHVRRSIKVRRAVSEVLVVNLDVQDGDDQDDTKTQQIER